MQFPPPLHSNKLNTLIRNISENEAENWENALFRTTSSACDTDGDSCLSEDELNKTDCQVG
jgi:hypothetical protein